MPPAAERSMDWRDRWQLWGVRSLPKHDTRDEIARASATPVEVAHRKQPKEFEAMTSKPIKVPGPDHPIAIVVNPSRVVVSVGGRIVADTREALTLREATYPGVQYLPRKDVDLSLLERTDHASHCPYKGDCAYYSIASAGGERLLNAVWSYETPYAAVAEIKDYLAFYPDRIDVREEQAEA